MGKEPRSGKLIKVGAVLLLVAILAYAVVVKPPGSARREEGRKGGGVPEVFDPLLVRLMPEEVARLPIATRFDWPMGGEGGELVYNARPFREVGHLGDDFNGIGGTDSDLGDAVYAVGAGEVVYVGTPSPGWGTVVLVAHRVPEEGGFRVVQSFYAHLSDLLVYVGQVVQRGDRIGRVGPTAEGSNWPHLHFELRSSLAIAPGVGYADSAMDRLDPEAFFSKYRGAPAGDLHPAPREEAVLPEMRVKGDEDEEAPSAGS